MVGGGQNRQYILSSLSYWNHSEVRERRVHMILLDRPNRGGGVLCWWWHTMLVTEAEAKRKSWCIFWGSLMNIKDK